MNAYCSGPYVHLIEFATFQARCQMDSLLSGERGNVSVFLFSPILDAYEDVDLFFGRVLSKYKIK